MSQDLYKQLPGIDKWLSSETGAALTAEFSAREVVEVMREQLARVRQGLGDGLTELPRFDSPQYAALMRAELLKQRLPSLRRAINATGIILHTNLGRAPLADEAVAAVADAARGYSSLELDLETGKRGCRYRHVESLLRRITGAPAALVVNNCAAAVFVALSTLAVGREVVISRGELVEIGGSFRIPDVIAASGARLVEVGTTNRTRIEDYAAALTDETRVVLSVHPSNYRIIGFTARPECRALAALAHRHDRVFMQDLGSGALTGVGAAAAVAEPTVQRSLAAGADLVTFSGDKLLGGPQAGILLGRAALVDAVRRQPLVRALRIDKLSLAALAATLRLYLPPNDPVEKIPVLRMIHEDEHSVGRRAGGLLRRLKRIAGLDGRIAADVSYGGGGALPMYALPTRVVHVTAAGLSAGELARRLRAADPPVIARVKGGQLALDPRTVPRRDMADLVAALRQAVE